MKEHDQMNLEFALKALISDYRQICSYYNLRLPAVNFEFVSHQSYWGQYDSKSSTVKLNVKLLTKYPWPIVLGVLKHELAHHCVYQKWKNTPVDDHGPEFHAACVEIGVPPFFRRAQVDLTMANLDWKTESLLSAENPLFEKITKLMALACSENEHESKLASQKIQELMTKNQITHIEQNNPLNYQHLNIIFDKSRLPLYIKQIISILVEHFYVYAVFQTSVDIKKSSRIAFVELIGRPEDLLIAESVYHFLLNEVKDLFRKNKSKNFSQVDKKSLAWGFLDGFSKQLDNDKTVQIRNLQSKALVLKTAEEKLLQYSRSIFPRLRNTGSRQRINQEAYNHGHEIGKKVKLRQVIGQKSKAIVEFLGFKT